MQEVKMKTTTKIILIALLILAVMLVMPIFLVWLVNSIAKAGGADFYLQHNAWNYVLTLLFFMAVRGGKL